MFGSDILLTLNFFLDGGDTMSTSEGSSENSLSLLGYCNFSDCYSWSLLNLGAPTGHFYLF